MSGWHSRHKQGDHGRSGGNPSRKYRPNGLCHHTRDTKPDAGEEQSQREYRWAGGLLSPPYATLAR
eukprot:4943928-Prymnesium_polylepis.1